jgi:hypothetical protein
MDAQLDDDYAPGALTRIFDGVSGGAVVTYSYLAECLEVLVESLRAASLKRDAEIAELRGENAALRRDNAALKKEVEALEHCGVWEMGRGYARKNLVTFQGSTWIALRDNNDRPGTPGAWRLIAKRGRDGKDADRI